MKQEFKNAIEATKKLGRAIYKAILVPVGKFILQFVVLFGIVVAVEYIIKLIF